MTSLESDTLSSECRCRAGSTRGDWRDEVDLKRRAEVQVGLKSTIVNMRSMPDLSGCKAIRCLYCLRHKIESARITASRLALQSFRTREYSRGPRSAKRLLEAVQNVSDQVPICVLLESYQSSLLAERSGGDSQIHFLCIPRRRSQKLEVSD